MAISKITYKSSPSATPETWMDSTGATAEAADIVSPKTAMLADGVVTPGTGVAGWSETTIATAGAVTQALDAGVIYHFTGALSALTLTLNAPASGQIAEYHFDFSTGSTPPTLTLPQTVTMPDGFSVEANKRYEVDILNNFGAVISWTLS